MKAGEPVSTRQTTYILVALEGNYVVADEMEDKVSDHMESSSALPRHLGKPRTGHDDTSSLECEYLMDRGERHDDGFRCYQVRNYPLVGQPG
jgi:hypothetical protein